MAVIGDPAGMRAAAAQLRFRAEQLSRLAGDVDVRTEQLSFTGPAANRWRGAVSDQSARLRIAGSRIAEAADVLARDAARVEEAQRLDLLTGGLQP